MNWHYTDTTGRNQGIKRTNVVLYSEHFSDFAREFIKVGFPLLLVIFTIYDASAIYRDIIACFKQVLLVLKIASPNSI